VNYTYHSIVCKICEFKIQNSFDKTPNAPRQCVGENCKNIFWIAAAINQSGRVDFPGGGGVDSSTMILTSGSNANLA
jgi:hypothetical protein